MKNTRKRLEEIAKLEKGWLDGEGDPFSVDHINNARIMIVSAMFLGFPEPYIYPFIDEIRLEWSFKSGDCMIIIHDDGSINMLWGTPPFPVGWDLECYGNMETTLVEIGKSMVKIAEELRENGEIE